MRGLLVGFGSIGRRHLSNFHDLGVEDWAVVHTGLGTLPLETPFAVRTYSDLADALVHEDPGFVVVANPTKLHLATALACIEAGWHVLIEKPVSHSVDGLDRLAAASMQADIRVLVGFQFRFHPALHRIRELLGAGTVGSPLHARVVWAEHLPSWHPWEDWRVSYAARSDLGGGVHHTICHPFDYLRMLFGDPVGLVGALESGGPLGLDVPESADVTLRFGRGFSAQVHLDYWTRPPVHRIDISCTDGSIRWDYITGDLDIWDQHTEAWRTENHPGVVDRNDLFRAEARHFLDVIEGRAAPACALADGIAVVRICAAIDRSAEHDGLELVPAY